MSISKSHNETAAELHAVSAVAEVPHDESDLREQVRMLAADVKELARMSKDAIGQKVSAAKDATLHAVELGRDKVAHYGEVLADKAKEEPIKALLIAAGVGGVLGLILGRR